MTKGKEQKQGDRPEWEKWKLYADHLLLGAARLQLRKQSDQPDWKHWELYANFLFRELALMFCGQKSIFDIGGILAADSSFWKRFGHTFSLTLTSFGEHHGLSRAELSKRVKEMQKEIHSEAGPPFDHPITGLFYIIRRTLGNELAKKFWTDFVVSMILGILVAAYINMTQGKRPPYEWRAPFFLLELCENLPVAPDMEKLYYGKNTTP
jgi:hypothetical protein